MKSLKPLFCALALLCLLPVAAVAEMEDVVIETTRLSDSVAMMTGAGGNLAVCTGEDGTFLVDDQFAPLTEKILAAIHEISPGDVRFVLNTHWHGDHTGGNENLGKTGAVIVAHENVRKRMSVEQFNEFFGNSTPPSPHAALPVVTFVDGVTFHLNGEEIEVFHVAPAHTDGDAVVWFKDENILHTGDLVFYGLYPFIDVDSGGSVDGVIAACKTLVDLCDENTRVIPGHGTLTDREGISEYATMLSTIRDRIAAGIADGKDLEALQATHPTAEFDEVWGHGFIDGDGFTGLVYRALSGAAD